MKLPKSINVLSKIKRTRRVKWDAQCSVSKVLLFLGHNKEIHYTGFIKKMHGNERIHLVCVFLFSQRYVTLMVAHGSN